MPGPGEVGANTPVYVQTMTGKKIEVTDENKASLKNQGLLDENFKPISQPQGDEVSFSSNNVKSTPEDIAAQDARTQERSVNSQVDSYCGKLAPKCETDGLKDAVTKMSEFLKGGKTAKAAEQYKILLAAGVITEDLGKVPFKAEMEKVIQQEKVDDFADSLNTRENLAKLKEQYTENKAKDNDQLNTEGIRHGHRSYRRANKKLEKSANRQLALNKTYIKDKTYVIGGKEMTGEEAYEYSKKQAKAHGTWDSKAKEYTLMSDRGLKTAQKIKEKLNVDVFDADGNIDVEKAQAFAREYASTTGNRADKNELKQLAADLGVKEKDVKQFLKGINVDYQKDKRWIGAAAGVVVGAATTYLAAKAFAHGKTTGGTPDTEKTTIENKIITIIDKNGGKHTDTISNVITELIPGAPGKAVSWLSKVLPGLGIGIPAGVGTAFLVNALVNRDVNILKKGHTLSEALDHPEEFVKNKGNQDIMRQIADAPIGDYDPKSPEAKMIKLAILGQAMGANENEKGKLNKQELIGALAQIKQCKKDGNIPDLTVEQPGKTPEKPDKPEPPAFDPTKDGKNYKLGDRFWNTALNDGKGGYVKDADGKFITEISGEKANEIGAFGYDAKVNARPGGVKNAPVEENVEHDNAANANVAGKNLREYIHGLTYGNTSAVLDEDYIAEHGIEEAMKKPKQIKITDPTRGNKYVFALQEDGNYKLISAKRSDDTDLKLRDSNVYRMTPVQKQDKDTSNNVEAGYEYQLFNLSGKQNGEGITVSDDVNEQIAKGYKEAHPVKKGTKHR